MTSIQEDFLCKAALGARTAGHIFPQYAACEAALESSWGESQLAIRGNNLFGQKRSKTALSTVALISLPTREYLHGSWVTVNADWISFPDWSACFHARMQLLKSASRIYPRYAAALVATTGEDFIQQVSRTWSTDPARAGKVLAIYAAHRGCFSPALIQT